MQITAGMVKELRERTGVGMMECKQALVESDGDIEAAIEQLRKKGQAKADKKAGRIAAEGVIALAVSDDATRGALVEVNCETDFVANGDEFREFADRLAKRALDEAPADVPALLELPMAPGAEQTVEQRRQELVMKIGENIGVRRLSSVRSRGGRLGAYLHGGRIGVLVDVASGDEELAKDLAMHVAASRPLAVSEADIPAAVLDKEREIIKAQVADSGKPPEIQEKMISGRLAKYLREVTLLGQPFVKDTEVAVEKHLGKAGATVSGFVRYEVGEGVDKAAPDAA